MHVTSSELFYETEVASGLLALVVSTIADDQILHGLVTKWLAFVYICLFQCDISTTRLFLTSLNNYMFLVSLGPRGRMK